MTRTDFEGVRHRYGQRHNACPTSPVFRRLSAEVARRIARRYAGVRSIVAPAGRARPSGTRCIDEWDARGAEFVNPVRLEAGNSRSEVEARLVFELVIPHGAEVVGTYGADWYPGTPAVARNRFGAGHGWYVATALDLRGVSWVVRPALAGHGLTGRCADVPDLETALRVAPDGTRLLFLLNHRAETAEVAAPGGGVDLLSGERVAGGQRLSLDPHGVVVLREDG